MEVLKDIEHVNSLATIRNLRNFSDGKGRELNVVNYMLKMSHGVILLL